MVDSNDWPKIATIDLKNRRTFTLFTSLWNPTGKLGQTGRGIATAYVAIPPLRGSRRELFHALYDVSEMTAYDRYRCKPDPRSAGVDRTQGAYVSGNHGCVAYNLSAASGLGGCTCEGLGGEGVREWPFRHACDASRPRPPEGKEAIFLRGIAASGRKRIEPTIASVFGLRRDGQGRASWLENPLPIILSAARGLQEPQG